MLDKEIRNWLARYLSNEISLREFQEWYIPATWDVDESEDMAARDLAAKIDLSLSEYTNGHQSEKELRSELRSFIETCRVVIGTAAILTYSSFTSSSNSETRQSVPFDIEISMAP